MRSEAQSSPCGEMILRVGKRNAISNWTVESCTGGLCGYITPGRLMLRRECTALRGGNERNTLLYHVYWQ